MFFTRPAGSSIKTFFILYRDVNEDPTEFDQFLWAVLKITARLAFEKCKSVPSMPISAVPFRLVFPIMTVLANLPP